MYKEGLSVGLGQEGVAWGGTVWNILKGGGTGGEGKQRFLKGGGTSWVKGNYDPIKTFTSNPWLSSFWRNSQYPQG